MTGDLLEQFDYAAAHAHGALMGFGRKARGRRVVDLLIVATAFGMGLPLFTRNPGDFDGMEAVLNIQ